MILKVINEIENYKWELEIDHGSNITSIDYNDNLKRNRRINNVNNNGQKKITVIWIRHCESCANKAFFLNLSKKVFREPLCTKKGVHQAVNCGYYLYEYLKKLCEKNGNNNKCNIGKNHIIAVYASFLPRAFTTAKLITYGIAQHMTSENNKYQLPGENKYKLPGEIKRICNIVEVQHGFIDALRSWSKLIPFRKSNNENKTTTNTTTLQKSNCHIKYINKELKNKGIDLSGDEACYKSVNNDIEIKGIIEKKLSKTINTTELTKLLSDYIKFIKEYIISDNGLDKQKINIIVGHGHYIRRNVLMSVDEKKRIPNTYGYMVEYCCDTNNNVTVTIKEEVKNDKNDTELDYPTMKECGDYTYHRDIKCNPNTKLNTPPSPNQND